jgi:hypothetical protein
MELLSPCTATRRVSIEQTQDGTTNPRIGQLSIQRLCSQTADGFGCLSIRYTLHILLDCHQH